MGWKILKKVGIDDFATYIPKLYLDTEEFAQARGIDPGKITKGLGIEKMSIPDTHEDAATMAAMAALRVMKKNNLNPKDIDFIHVATETGPDAAKPISSYVQGMLEQVYGARCLDHIGAPETKFACVGATYALIDRLAYIASGWNKRKYAIVIATDISKYELHSSGESTQGAAAVALLLSENPRLLVYEPKFTGFGTVDDQDFYRPIERTTAVVNGQYSIGCYLRDMRIAADMYKNNLIKAMEIKSEPKNLSHQLDLISFHSPFPKMVQYAFASFLIHDWRQLPKWTTILSKIGPEPVRKGVSNVEFYVSKEYKQFRSRFSKTEEFTNEYNKKVADSLIALKLIGNSYTAAVWLGMASHFENRRDELEEKRLAICSYGSGSSAIACSFIIQPEYKEVIQTVGLMKDLSRRKKISVQVYEDLHEGRLNTDESIIPPQKEFMLEYIGKESTNIGYRYYKYIE
jgi:hydroxymethylglutaryl-CoA synthase